MAPVHFGAPSPRCLSSLHWINAPPPASSAPNNTFVLPAVLSSRGFSGQTRGVLSKERRCKFEALEARHAASINVNI